MSWVTCWAMRMWTPTAEPDDVTSATLDAGERHTQDSTTNLVVMDLALDAETVNDTLAAPADENQWLTDFLVNGAEEDATNPNDEIVLVMPEEDPTSDIEEPETSAETATDPVSDPQPAPAASGNSKGKGKNK